MGNVVSTAFVLGAGLGTRLRPLTADRPKPLVPIFHKPLITFAFDHLHAVGVRKFVVNTHHCPEAYSTLLGAHGGRTIYREAEVFFQHEDVLLDTGGGIKNVEPYFTEGSFLVQNGDVLADLDLQRLIEKHEAGGNLATLGLRSSGGPLQVQMDAEADLVTDIRGVLGGSGPKYLFTGIYILSPRIFDHIPADKIISIVPVLLDLIRAGQRIGGVVLDDGIWFDLGTRESYLEAHRLFAPGNRKLSYPLDRPWPQAVHPDATVQAGAELQGATAVGAGAFVGEGAVLKDSVIWENAEIASRSRLDACIVRDGKRAEGDLHATDI